MIPFFRKIRFKLAKDNQFFKYSRYAIGEILLVMVGILLALQVNNWNEDRKDKFKTGAISEETYRRFGKGYWISSSHSFIEDSESETFTLVRYPNAEIEKVEFNYRAQLFSIFRN